MKSGRLENFPKKWREAISDKKCQRNKRLVFILGFVVALYSGVWFVLEYMVHDYADHALQKLNQQGQRIACDNLRKSGYPLRIGLACDALRWQGGDGRYALITSAIVVAAPIYAPSWRTLGLAAPVLVDLADSGRIEAVWNHLALTADMMDERPSALGLTIEYLQLNLTDHGDAVFPLLQADFAALQIEHDVAQIKISLSFDALRLPEMINDLRLQEAAVTGEALVYLDPLPVRILDFDLAEADLQQIVHGISGRLEKVDLQFLSGGGLSMKGDFHISDAGILSGQFKLHMLEAAALLRTIRTYIPAQASNLESLFFVFNAMPKDEQGNPIITIDIEEGRMRAGFIPLAQLPSF